MVFRDIFIVVVSIFLILSLTFTSIALGLEIFLYPQVYHEAFEESNVFEKISEFKDDIPGGEFVKIPNNDLQILAEDLINNSLDYLRGDVDKLNLTLSIDSEELLSFFESQAEKLPTCAEGVTFSIDENVCIPEGVNTREFVKEFLEEQNVTILDEGKVDLKEIYGLEEEQLEKARTYVSYYNYTKYGLILLSMILLGMMFLVAKDSKRAFIFSGVSFFVSGLIIIGAMMFASNQNFLVMINLAFLADFVNALVNSFISKEMFYGIFLTLTGAILFGFSFFIKKEKS
ncbi:MAG TPA: hypothetical protein VJZ93_02540 [Candidatus Nanoarchaeia archaeon]|nr:hypothetical protein [Candidatus Nanoarchaeia archaeon]